jgi:hypothetical protein
MNSFWRMLLIRCSNSSLLECSPPKARVRFPAETCQSPDLKFRMKMTLVKSLSKGFTKGKNRLGKKKVWESRKRLKIQSREMNSFWRVRCSNSFLLECSPPIAEAQVRFPAETCQSRDWRMEITLVKSLHKRFTKGKNRLGKKKVWEARKRLKIQPRAE